MYNTYWSKLHWLNLYLCRGEQHLYNFDFHIYIYCKPIELKFTKEIRISVQYLGYRHQSRCWSYLWHSHWERSRRSLCSLPHHCHYHSHLSIKKASDYYYIVTKRGVGGACAFSPITVSTTHLSIKQSLRLRLHSHEERSRRSLCSLPHYCHYHSHLSIKQSLRLRLHSHEERSRRSSSLSLPLSSVNQSIRLWLHSH